MKLINNQQKEQKEQKVSFLGKRTDKNLVNELTTESGALFKPKQRAISEAIVRLGMNGSSDNVNFLFSVVENLNYGLKKDSELSNFINKESYVTNVLKKQNNEWEEQLKKALCSSIEMNKTPESAEFKKRFEDLFGAVKEEKLAKSVVNSPISVRVQQQRELTALRNGILQSESLKDAPESFNEKQQQNFNVDKKKLYKNLDYFIASSEVATGEKLECLKIIKHMASDDYKTNPQLKDYKVKILSEILTDLVVEQPNQVRLTSKEIAQRKHGMCAAISISRKAIPQEHKLAFVSKIAAELDDKPYVEVYNVTSKDLSETVKVKKADIDYKQGLEIEDYRITDAAVCNWMHIADTYGDGTQKYGWFKSYDGENYGIFRDAHLTNDLEGVDKSKQYTLRSLIKLDSKGEEIAKAIKDYSKATLDRKTIDESFISTSKKTHDNTEIAIKKLAGVSNDKAREIANIILSDAYLQKIRKPFVPQYTKNEEFENAKEILKHVVDCNDNKNLDEFAKTYLSNYMELASVKSEKSGNDKKLDLSSYEHMERLFDFAAYTRVKTEYELDIPEKLNEQAEKFGVKNDVTPEEVKAAVLNKMENAGIVMKRKDLDEIKGKIYERTNFERRGMGLGDRRAEKAADQMVIVTPQQAEMLKKVERNFAQSYKEVKKQYKAYRDDLAPELEKLYAEKKFGGRFWDGEEGHSGLCTAQQIRVIEQMSGKEHYIETNASKAMDHIERAEGVGTLSSDVSDTDAAFHAQRIYDVKKNLAKNSETGKPEVQRFLYTDNSWGSSDIRTSYKPEVGRSYWKDSEGNLRTDYGRNLNSEFGEKGGFGYKQGFLLDKNYTIGVSEDDTLSGRFTFKHEVNGKSEEISGPIFSDILLRGSNSHVSDYDAFGIQQSLFSAVSQKSVRDGNALVTAIKTGNVEDIACLLKDLKKHLQPKLSSYAEKSGDELNDAIKEDVETIVSTFPSRIFKADKNEKIANPAKLTDALVKNLKVVIENAKKSGSDDIQKRCLIANESVKAIEDAVLENTTPIYKPHYDQFECVKDKFQKESTEFMNKFTENKSDTINTREKFEALPEDSKVKLTLKKAALFEQMYNIETGLISENLKISDSIGASNFDFDSSLTNMPEEQKKSRVKGLSLDDVRSVSDKIVFAKNSEDLNLLKKDFRKLSEDQIILAFDKNILEKMNKAPNNIAELKTIPCGKEVIDYIDAKYDPSSDEECMSIYNKILDMPKEEQVNLVRSSNDAEVGFKAPDYYNYAQRLRGEEAAAKDCAQSVIIYDLLTKDFELEAPFKEGTSKADRLFIALSNTMAYAEIGTWIKQNKTRTLNSFKAYPAIPILEPFSGKELDAFNKDMVVQLKEVVVKINDYKAGKGFEKGTPASKIDGEIQSEKKILRERVRIVANSCVQPRYVDEVIGKMNEYFSEMGKDPESQKAKDSETKLLESMSKYSISKNPKELFNSFVKDITEENDYGTDDTRNNIIQLKSIFIGKICDASDKTKLEFDLILATREGKMSSVARNLKTSKFGIAQVDRKEGLPWNSKEGINLLVNNLKDDTNNNSTLKLFLTETGMVSDAINGLIKGPSPAKTLLHVQNVKTATDEYVAEQDEINKNYKAWEKSNDLTDAQKNSVNIDEVRDIVNKYLEDVKPIKAQDHDSPYSEYKKTMQEELEMNDMNAVRISAPEFIEGIHKNYMKTQESVKEEAIEKILVHKNALYEKVATLKVIESLLNPDDEKKNEVEQYLKSATEAADKIKEVEDSLQNGILDKIDQISKAEKAEAELKKKAISAVQGTSGDGKVNAGDSDKEMAKNLFADLVKADLAGYDNDTKNALSLILHTENPEMPKLLAQKLKDESCKPILREYCALSLAQKKEFAPIKEYLTTVVSTGDDSKLDSVALTCVDGAVVASILMKGDEKKEYLDLVSKTLKISCDANNKSDKATDLMMQLRKSLSNKSVEINNMLMDYAVEKNSNEALRILSMDILSRSASGEFEPLLEDVVLNPNKYANNPSEALKLFDVCLLGIRDMRLDNPEIKVSNEEAFKNLDVKEIVEKAMPDKSAETKDFQVEGYNRRIECILSDEPLELYNKTHKSDDSNNLDDSLLVKNPISNPLVRPDRMEAVTNYIKYNSQFLPIQCLR